MAKPPETRDRFKIFVETSKEQMGDVIVVLTKMGFENIGHELITDVKAWGRKTHDTTAADAIAEYIKENPTFRARDLIAHLKLDGRNNNAVYSGIRTMLDKKLLIKLGEGNYQRADVKALAAPKAAPDKRPAKKSRAGIKPYEITNYDLIWRHFKNRQSFKAKDVAVLFRANNRPDKSATSTLSTMTTKKIFRRVGEGRYEVVKEKATAAKKKVATKRSKHQPSIESPVVNASASTSGTIVYG
jgi:hypothetical protein